LRLPSLLKQRHSVDGQFSYDETNAPATISESGTGATKFLKSLSFSAFDPSKNLLESGSTVVNGVSSDPFLIFNFDTVAKKITGLDVTGNQDNFFLSNAVTPNGNFVGAGNSDYNFFFNNKGTQKAVFVDTASSVRVTAVPESTPVLGLLAFGVSAASLLKRSQSKQKSASSTSVKA
jgi:hypothetical protein